MVFTQILKILMRLQQRLVKHFIKNIIYIMSVETRKVISLSPKVIVSDLKDNLSVENLNIELSGDWTIAYFIGGGLGLLLLIFRIGVSESGIFKDIETESSISKGNFFSFFTNRNRFMR